ncbi:MAG: MgtC/SapB family protein [Chroococcidiopsidaceae cyanobacterium CP_BM_ER_R8_30]|nr:MgtC/SapB family protein [Chroococcidiopsidaceae cyanobacterium CP_BM_ER_R8_30]
MPSYDVETLSVTCHQALDLLKLHWIAAASTPNSIPSAFSELLYWQKIERLLLALAIGLFVGLEREWRRKQAGVRTFGFVALLGSLGGLLGQNYALLSIALLGVPLVFLNLQTLRVGKGTELTTSVALVVTGLTGVLCGQGETVTPVAVAVITAATLSGKERLKGFSLGLSAAELRSAIVLAMLTFVIYPALPKGIIDPWGLVQPQEIWLTVILVAGIGFVNYVLWKMYGARGIELTGFLGGLVNSSVAVIELAKRVRETEGRLAEVAYRGIILATAAMLVRNTVLLAILSPVALQSAVLALALMIATMGLAFVRYLPLIELLVPPRDSQPCSHQLEDTPLGLNFESPFSLQSALKFGLIFLGLQIGAVLAQKLLGHLGFYAVSLIGGLISSASAVASAATLAANHTLEAQVAGTGAVLASMTSALVNLPLVARLSQEHRLTQRLVMLLGFSVILGFVGILFSVAWS